MSRLLDHPDGYSLSCAHEFLADMMLKQPFQPGEGVTPHDDGSVASFLGDIEDIGSNVLSIQGLFKSHKLCGHIDSSFRKNGLQSLEQSPTAFDCLLFQFLV